MAETSDILEMPAFKALSPKQQAFVLSYCGEARFNATRSAEIVGYAHPNTQGPRLLLNVGVRAAIKEVMQEKAMSTEEALLRMSEWGEGSLEHFLGEDGRLDINSTRARRYLHLLKKVKQKDGEIEIELHDAKDAVKTILSAQGVSTGETPTNRVEVVIVQPGEKPPNADGSISEEEDE